MMRKLYNADALYYGSPLGLFIIRLGTREKKTNQEIWSHVKKAVKNKVRERAVMTGSMYLLDNATAALEQINVDRVVYSKVKQVYSRADNSNFWQHDLAIDITLDNIDLGQFIGGSYGSGVQPWICSEWVEEGFLEIMVPDTKGKITKSVSFNSRETTAWYTDTEAQDFSYIPCICLKAKISTTYKSKHKVKLGLEFYENAEEAIKHGGKDLIAVAPMSRIYPAIHFSPIEQTMSNTYRFRTFNPNKTYGHFVGNTLLIYNGHKSVEVVMEAFGNDIRLSGAHVFQIVQYEPARDICMLINQVSGTYSSGRIRFVDGYKIDYNRTRRDSNGTQKVFNISLHNKPNSFYCSWSTVPGYSSDMLNLVVPYYNDNQEKSKYALSLIKQMFNISSNSHIRALRPTTDDVNRLTTAYYDLLHTWPETDDKPMEDDVLAHWFKHCTRTTMSNDEKIVAAYKNMKTKLEKELLEIGEYVNGFDFSKMMPIPKVTLDKKIKENFYKCISTDVEKRTLTRVMGKAVVPKEIITTQIRFMTTASPSIYVKNFSIKDLYDANKNEIVLDYNKLKGATIHDQAKNRR